MTSNAERIDGTRRLAAASSACRTRVATGCAPTAGALTTLNRSQDFLLVRGQKRLTVTLQGCRMRNYAADQPVTVENRQVHVRAVACVDREEKVFDLSLGGEPAAPAPAAKSR